MTPVMRGAIRCGENSLAIYCLGVLLALASHIALVNTSDGLAMQIALSLAGTLVMVAAATLLNPGSNRSGSRNYCDGRHLREMATRRMTRVEVRKCPKRTRTFLATY
jgi:OpgC protein